MLNGIREMTVVKEGGFIEIPATELPVGTQVEVIILAEEMDETDYLLSTEANRRSMYEALEELNHPENFIPLDIEEYEKRLTNS